MILPIVGVLDSARAAQLTEQLLKNIRANRAKVVVLDVTGVPTVDSKTLGVDLSRLEAVSDLQRGIEKADQLIGYKVTFQEPAAYV